MGQNSLVSPPARNLKSLLITPRVSSSWGLINGSEGRQPHTRAAERNWLHSSSSGVEGGCLEAPGDGTKNFVIRLDKLRRRLAFLGTNDRRLTEISPTIFIRLCYCVERSLKAALNENKIKPISIFDFYSYLPRTNSKYSQNTDPQHV